MTWRSLFMTLLSLVVAPHIAVADELAPYEVVADGRQYQITLGVAEQNLKTISIYFVSTGNVSNTASVEVLGPAGIVGTARGGAIGSKLGAEALATSATLQSYQVRAYPNLTAAGSFATTAPAGDLSLQYASAFFTIQKDACSGSKKSRYVAQVKLDLSKIDSAAYTNGFTIMMVVKETPFDGRGVASIKPAADGLYKGQPILLMQSVGYGNEYVTKVTWKRNRIVKTKRFPIVKYVSHRGYSLSLGLLNGLLKGGLHTFELSNGTRSYGACLKAVRERQRVNGYPQ